MKILKAVYPYFVIFLIYFLLCAFVITCSFLLFLKNLDIAFTAEQLTPAARFTFINTIILAGVLVWIDTIRRKITVERPVKQINEALRKMMTGDFSVCLNPQYSQHAFAEIMKNINLAAKELSGVETLRSDFIANVSHEMKTPLAVMQNYGTLLGTPMLAEDKRMEYAKAITDSCKRLADLMTNILKLNRLENQ
ncbi:MAG: histidine kinase dimerization/phospho-acceptor domain-containing protein, partial [Eubacteriales bacterium]